jgi:cell division protein FtsB
MRIKFFPFNKPEAKPESINPLIKSQGQKINYLQAIIFGIIVVMFLEITFCIIDAWRDENNSYKTYNQSLNNIYQENLYLKNQDEFENLNNEIEGLKEEINDLKNPQETSE